MSHGPGRVQRAILDLIATPEAMASYDLERDPYGGPPGPVGVPLDAVFDTVYNTYRPTRAQRVAVHRAVRVLCARGLIDTYSRRVCHRTPAKVAGYNLWDYANERFPCCGYGHPPTTAVGRPRTDAENEKRSQAMAQAMALLRSLR